MHQIYKYFRVDLAVLNPNKQNKYNLNAVDFDAHAPSHTVIHLNSTLKPPRAPRRIIKPNYFHLLQKNPQNRRRVSLQFQIEVNVYAARRDTSNSTFGRTNESNAIALTKTVCYICVVRNLLVSEI